MYGPNGIVSSWSTTDTNVYKKEHIWIISQYSFHDAKKKTLSSSTFTSDLDGITKCTWHLDLKPHGEPESDGSISLFLYLHKSSPCKHMFAKFRSSVLTAERKEMYISDHPEIREFCAVSGLDSWGYGDVLNRDTLFDKKDELLPNDKLTIFCEITYSQVDFTSTSHQSNLITFQPPVTNRLSEDFGSILKNGKFADVTILVNGTEYPVHKTILAARSAVFSAMFEQHGMQESEKNRIDVTDISQNVMEEMLRYIYTGNVGNLDELADDLFEAADKYDLGELKALCENFLNNDLSIDNAASTLALADLHRAYELKSKTMDYIVTKFSKVKRTEGWKALAASRNDLLNEVCEALSRKLDNN
ncbi:hypothetical protein U1Q18_046957 [Sarracenia purpurea var. burkii]